MRRKVWKIVGISIAIVVVLGLLFVLAFIFNPFEGSLPDMRELVPRDTDYFVRKTELRSDFASFPEPAFWPALAESRAFSDMRRGPITGGLERDLHVEKAVEALRDVSRQIHDASGGFADLLKDVLGQEVLIAGRLDGGPQKGVGFCAYLRVSWKVRFAWGLLEWQSVRDKVAAGGTKVEKVDDKVMRFTPPGGQPLLVARWLDCLMVSNDEQFLNKSLELARGAIGADSFGGSSDYRDGVEARIREWEDQSGVAANAVELYARPDRLLSFTAFDDNWPDPRDPDDMNERVLASFVNLKTWRFLSGSLIFQPNSLTVLGRIDLNRNMHTGFQTQFFKTEAQDRKEWLVPFLTMVPATACASAALRVPAGDFLQEMLQAVNSDLRQELDRAIQKTGKFDSASHLIDAIRPALLQRVGFVFHPKEPIGLDDKGKPIETFEPSPAPHVAWVFWVDPRFRSKIEEVAPFLTQNAATLGFANAYDLPVQGGAGGDSLRELVSPNIPSTGEIALLLYGNFFIVGNSGPLIRRMVRARLDGDNLLASPGYLAYSKEMSSRFNGFVYLDGDNLAKVAEDYLSFAEQVDGPPDPAWMAGVRPNIENQVLRSDFQSYRNKSSLTAADREKFDAAVVRRMNEMWTAERPKQTAVSRATYGELRGLFHTFSSAYLEATFDPQWLSFKLHVLTDYR
ncbi:MAG: hypothetical protein U1F36_14440 [Planctomycetota bacterium]